jgi:hypothetical protein
VDYIKLEEAMKNNGDMVVAIARPASSYSTGCADTIPQMEIL